MSAALALTGVSKLFGGLRAVDDVSLAVQPGERRALIGPNGAGKTTLFNVLTGFHRPDSGRIVFRGDDITGLPPYEVFRRGICRTFQIPREFKDLTVLENLLVVPPDQTGERLWTPWLAPQKIRREEARLREQAQRVLEQVGLTRVADDPAWTLSGGQKKLLELARALMADPKLLMLDEPGAGVNPTQMKELTRYIQWLASERGVSILLIEHDMDLVFSFADTITVLVEGAVLTSGPAEAIARDQRVRAVYLGEEAHG